MEFKGKITFATAHGALKKKDGSVITKKDGSTLMGQSVVIQEEKDQYPESVSFDVKDKDFRFSVGETCTVHLNITAREYQGRYFNNIECWKKEGGVTSAPTQAPAPTPPQTLETDDEFPF